MGNMLTIKQTVARAAAEGMPISEYTLRHWVKVGIIPSRIAGRSKYLIYYPNLVRYLQCVDGGDIPPATLTGAGEEMTAQSRHGAVAG